MFIWHKNVIGRKKFKKEISAKKRILCLDLYSVLYMIDRKHTCQTSRYE